MKTRREFVQGLIFSVGGASLLSACGDVASIVATAPGESGRFYNNEEMAQISRISDLIIPRTETPGALDANVPGYLDALMSDWAREETRIGHREALKLITARLDDISGDFAGASEADANIALAELDAIAFAGDEALIGYRTLKGYVTQAYFATEEGAMEELQWLAIPGHWDPSVNITIED
jgi:hypothetical protein